MKSSLLIIHFGPKKEYSPHCLFSDCLKNCLLLRSDCNPHWFKESHDHNVRQVLKTWENHMIRMKDPSVSSYNERSMLDWRRTAYGEKKSFLVV